MIDARLVVRFAAVAAASAAVLGGADAHAAGLYFADRGVRPLSRAGAFIAGGDDLGAIAYNPAGVYDAGAQFLIDGAWLHFTSDYQRKTVVKSASGARAVQTFEAVEGTSPVLPIPTLAVSFQPHERVVVAVGAWAPYAAITSYPTELGGGPAPQRYALITLDGSALGFLGVVGAFAPSPEWRLGVGVGVLAGTFRSTEVFSACPPDRFACAHEDPRWDVQAELSVGPIVTPAGEAGVIWAPSPRWRIGAAAQLPLYVRAPATIRTRLPPSEFFDEASQEGEDADVAFDLPWNVRVGVETRVVERLRLEAGFGYERWGMHDQITITPDHVALKNVALFPETYYVPEVVFPRNFQDSVSVRLGGEYTFDLFGYPWDVRAGASFETSAVPPEYLSVLTIDSNKVALAAGLGLHIGKWRFDFGYAHVFAFDVEVDPAEARIPQVSPVVANPPPEPHYVNGGSYSARADVIGVGLSYTFEPVPIAMTPGGGPPAKPSEAPKPGEPGAREEEPKEAQP